MVAALDNLFANEGTPGILQCDNGTEFKAATVSAYLDAMQVEVRHGRARHPQTQGQIERYVRPPKGRCNVASLHVFQLG